MNDMKYVVLFTLAFGLIPKMQSQKIPSAEWQIKTALMAIPEANRAETTVLGYDQSGKLISLRDGSNDFIALADDPKKENFSTAGYHKDLEPFMARGRQLRAEGKEFQEVFDIREAEVKSGKLSMPDKASLCIFTATIDSNTGEIENSYKRYVFYIPYATGASTGLPTTPTPPGQPWLMDAGTHRAHIMITPPK